MALVLEKITALESPIDVMQLMHKAYMLVSERTEVLAEKAQSGGSLSEFEEGLGVWLKHLLYHAQTEDTYMTGPLKDIEHQDGRRPARDNEKEHDELRRLGGGIAEYMGKGEKAALFEEVSTLILANEEQEHANLIGKAESVGQVLEQALGETRILGRTRRHLYQKVMEFRIAEFDHFENEVAFVLPLVKAQMSPEQELECSRRLLIDDDAENPRWVIECIYGELDAEEQELLKELESLFYGDESGETCC